MDYNRPSSIVISTFKPMKMLCTGIQISRPLTRVMTNRNCNCLGQLSHGLLHVWHYRLTPWEKNHGRKFHRSWGGPSLKSCRDFLKSCRVPEKMSWFLEELSWFLENCRVPEKMSWFLEELSWFLEKLSRSWKIVSLLKNCPRSWKTASLLKNCVVPENSRSWKTVSFVFL